MEAEAKDLPYAGGQCRCPKCNESIVLAASGSCQNYKGTIGLRWNSVQREFLVFRDHRFFKE